MIAVANEPKETEINALGLENGLNGNWLPFVGDYRTFLAGLAYEGWLALDEIAALHLCV